MGELKDQEERLRFLVSKVDSEIKKFQGLLDTAETLGGELDEAVRKEGLQSVPIAISPHSEESEGLAEELKQHIMDLNKLKNLINAKLNLVIKEEELIEGLQRKYGNKVSLKRISGGDFEINYADDKTDNAFNQLKNSKKLIAQLKDSVDKIVSGKAGSEE